MAIWKFPLLLLGLSLIVVSVNARPCKTLFFFTFASYYPIPTVQSSNPNPNFSLQHPFLSPQFLTFFFTTSSRALSKNDTKFQKNIPSDSFRPKAILFDQEDQLVERGEEEEKYVFKRLYLMFPTELYSFVKSSVRGWKKDITGVMGDILFGVGCSALTTATMYLIWSLFSYNSNHDDDDASPKNMGYVVISTRIMDDILKKIAKEIV